MGSKTLCWTERNKQAERKREGHRHTTHMQQWKKREKLKWEMEGGEGHSDTKSWPQNLWTVAATASVTPHRTVPQLSYRPTRDAHREKVKDGLLSEAHRSPLSLTWRRKLLCHTSCHGHPSPHSEGPIGQNRQQGSRRGRSRERLCRRVFGKLLTTFWKMAGFRFEKKNMRSQIHVMWQHIGCKRCHHTPVWGSCMLG